MSDRPDVLAHRHDRPRRRGPDLTGLRTPAAPAAATVAAIAIGAAVASAGAEDGLVLCPFRRCTGGYCPGCGATRAANRFVRGDLEASWSHHPWVVLAALQAVVLGAATARLSPANRRARLRRVALPALVGNCLLLITIWIVRVADGTVPTGWL